MRGAEEPGSNELTRLVVSKCTKYFVVPLLHPINSTETNGDNAIVSWFIFAILLTTQKGPSPKHSHPVSITKSIYVWLWAVNSPISERSAKPHSAAPIGAVRRQYLLSHMPSFDLQFLPGHLSDGEGRRKSFPLRGRIESYYIQHICLFLLVSVNQDASHGVPDRGKKQFFLREHRETSRQKTLESDWIRGSQQKIWCPHVFSCWL
jgi:hypothetical protein